MLRFTLCVGIILAAYFAAVGFIRTSNKMGWSEAEAVDPPAKEAPKGKK
jgi:hypothetical protein